MKADAYRSSGGDWLRKAFHPMAKAKSGVVDRLRSAESTAHCQPWTSLHMLRHFRVLILNAGAHRVPIDAFRLHMSRVGSVTRSFLDEDDKTTGRRTVVWRANVPGFSGCNETHNAPSHASLEQAEAYLAAHPFHDQHSFMPLRNRIAAAEIGAAGGRILDVYAESIMRIDDRRGAVSERGGVDCLHFRGPPYKPTSLGRWAASLGTLLREEK